MWPAESWVGSENPVSALERIQIILLYHLSPFPLGEVELEAETGHGGAVALCFITCWTVLAEVQVGSWLF